MVDSFILAPELTFQSVMFFSCTCVPVSGYICPWVSRFFFWGGGQDIIMEIMLALNLLRSAYLSLNAEIKSMNYHILLEVIFLENSEK